MLRARVTSALWGLGIWAGVGASALAETQPRLPPCTEQQVAQLAEAIKTAPSEPDAMGEGGGEKRCQSAQATVVRRILAACMPPPEQSVLWLGAGRCLQDAGLRHEAVRAYTVFLRLSLRDRSVSVERARDRRTRVRKWMVDLGEPDPPTAMLVLSHNMDGVMVRQLPGFPDGVTLGHGELRIPQPAGSRVLSLALPGFRSVELSVDLVDGEETRAEVDWQKHLLPKYAHLQPRFEEYRKSGLSPAGYLAQRRRPLPVILGFLTLGAGATLIGVCAGNVGESCDASWKQGLAYGAGGLLAVAGLLGVLGGLASPSEKLPPVVIHSPGPGALP